MRQIERSARPTGGARKPRSLLDDIQKLLSTLMHDVGPADRILSQYFKAHPRLGRRDRGAIAETVFAVIRRKSLYQYLAQSGSGPLNRRVALLAATDLGLDFSAECSEGEMAWLANSQKIDRTQLPDAVRLNLPSWLMEKLSARMGGEELAALTQAFDRPAPLDLRVNLLRATPSQALERLRDEGVAGEAVAEVPTAIRLKGKPALAEVGAFKDGWVEVQDAGSQRVAQLLAPKRGETVVDFCAGAGGKTLALGALMRNTGRIYAIDTSATRLQKLRPRLARSGLSNVWPIAIEHERDARLKRLIGRADRVLVDVPCSGTGTLRRQPEIKWRLSAPDIDRLQGQQRSILDSAARLVKPGGRLVYATCSILSEENVDVVDGFLAEHPEFQRVPVVSDEQPWMILLPHVDDCDGFFGAVLERRQGLVGSDPDASPATEQAESME